MKISVSKTFLVLFINLFIVRVSFCQVKNEAWYIKNAPFKMAAPKLPVFSGKVFSIKDYGAVAGGQTLNTTAFEKAITACNKAGGGKVTVPAGLWLTGPIQLKSNINLCVERGAIVLFTSDLTQYPIIKAGSNSNSFVPASPIYGYDVTNIAITGEGIIDGAGENWRPVKKSKVTDGQWKALLAKGGAVSNDGTVWWPSKEAMDGETYLKELKINKPNAVAEDYLPARTFLRPYMLYLVNCSNILVENITLRNSPKFVFYPTRCTNLTIRNATFFNEWWAQNGDAVDISACKNVLIYKVTVSAGDDGICMKSSAGKNDASGNFALENIVIAGCTVYHGHGGFVIGSNTDGGMRNIAVTDCSFIGTDIGVRVKSNYGRGGQVKDIYVSNIAMSDIVNEAVLFETSYEDLPAGVTKDSTIKVKIDKTPAFSRFFFNNIHCKGAKKAISITGLPEMPANNISFKNVTISSSFGLMAKDAADITLDNVKLICNKEPVNWLQNVQRFTVSNGYFGAGNKIFIKADAKSSGIKVNSTDLHGIADAVQLAQ